MSEKVAVVGSRWGYDEAHLVYFVNELHRSQPDTILLSGGAEGADTKAEDVWKMLGGVVWSFRPVKLKRGEGWGVQCLTFDDLGLPDITTHPLSVKTKQSALWLRTILLKEECDRLVAFMRAGGSRGTQFTIEYGHDWGKPTYVYEVPGPPPIPKWRREREDALSR